MVASFAFVRSCLIAVNFVAISLPGHNRSNDSHARQTRDTSNDVKLQIHLRHRFLHVLNVRGRVFDQHLTVPQVAAQ
jgi:hypothetical protein